VQVVTLLRVAPHYGCKLVSLGRVLHNRSATGRIA
jgi:hypothetical protein